LFYITTVIVIIACRVVYENNIQTSLLSQEQLHVTNIVTLM